MNPQVRKIIDGALQFGRRRVTQEMRDEVNSEIGRLETAIQRNEAIASLEDNAGWLALREDLSDKLQAVKSIMDRPDIPDIALRTNNVSRLRLEEFQGYVQAASEAIPGLRVALQNAKERRKSYGD